MSPIFAHTIPGSRRLFALLGAVALSGCLGDGADEASFGAAGEAPGEPAEAGAIAQSVAPLHDDLVTPDPPVAGLPGTEADTTTVRGQLTGSQPAPKVFYLHYADGSELPRANYDACAGKKPPKFECSFAPTLIECQRQIQAYLDKWYADFNIIFTLTRPTSGKYYTEVISSGGGGWCRAEDRVAGVAPFLCKDLEGGVAYTFQGGRSAKETAVIIAQEQAHLLGLEHTDSPRDLLYPTICAECDGFVNDDVPVNGTRCDRREQNSYKMMEKALGRWPGGPKPSPFGCMDDRGPPLVQFLSPEQTSSRGHDFSVKVDVRDDCDLDKVEITVMPQGLSAMAKQPPYEWDLTGINGRQTVTVVATDRHGHKGTASLEIVAPEGREEQDPDAAAAGCTVASGAFGAAGLVPSLAMLLLFSGHHRRSRRRVVPGALRE